MTAGQQSDLWRGKYETLWAVRQHLIGQWIAAGEKCPLRLINRLGRLEERQELMVSETNKEVVARKIKTDSQSCLPSGANIVRKAAFRGNYIEVPAHTYSNIPVEIANFIDNSDNKFDAIIELGCGFGQNLFRIYYSGANNNISYFGGELTDSGIELGKKLALLNTDIRIDFFKFDHLTHDISFIKNKLFERALVFTCHSLEQVKIVPQSFFDAVASCAKQVTCMHFEPFGFQLLNFGRASEYQKQCFESNDWNLNLFEASAEAEKRNIIKRTFMAPNVFLSNDEVNGTSLMVWESVL